VYIAHSGPQRFIRCYLEENQDGKCFVGFAGDISQIIQIKKNFELVTKDKFTYRASPLR